MGANDGPIIGLAVLAVVIGMLFMEYTKLKKSLKVLKSDIKETREELEKLNIEKRKNLKEMRVQEKHLLEKQVEELTQQKAVEILETAVAISTAQGDEDAAATKVTELANATNELNTIKSEISGINNEIAALNAELIVIDANARIARADVDAAKLLRDITDSEFSAAKLRADGKTDEANAANAALYNLREEYTRLLKAKAIAESAKVQARTQYASVKADLAAEKQRIADKDAAIAAELQRIIDERHRIAAMEAELERQRIAAIEAERQRIADKEAELERQRIANEEAVRDAERQRVADEEANKMSLGYQHFITDTHENDPNAKFWSQSGVNVVATNRDSATSFVEVPGLCEEPGSVSLQSINDSNIYLWSRDGVLNQKPFRDRQLYKHFACFKPAQHNICNMPGESGGHGLHKEYAYEAIAQPGNYITFTGPDSAYNVQPVRYMDGINREQCFNRVIA